METCMAWFQPSEPDFSYCHIDLYAPSLSFETLKFKGKFNSDSVQLLIYSFFFIVSAAKNTRLKMLFTLGPVALPPSPSVSGS